LTDIPETNFMGGGLEVIFDDLSKPIGMMAVAPLSQARGRMFSAKSRLGLGESQAAGVIPTRPLPANPQHTPVY
jgi:hypothetical protein